MAMDHETRLAEELIRKMRDAIQEGKELRTLIREDIKQLAVARAAMLKDVEDYGKILGGAITESNDQFLADNGDRLIKIMKDSLREIFYKSMADAVERMATVLDEPRENFMDLIDPQGINYSKPLAAIMITELVDKEKKGSKR
jgi:hypothetical protein